jgi:hypothetical protein
MSLRINSSGDNPGRFSHSGSHPAPGASRVGGASIVDAESWCKDDDVVVVVTVVNPIAAGAATTKEKAVREIFILLLYERLLFSLYNNIIYFRWYRKIVVISRYIEKEERK